MSENTKNEKVVVVAKLKSPVVGFVLALFLGWLGVDRFYKGGFLSILLGIIKLIFGVMLVFFGLTLIAGFGWLLLTSVLVADKDSQQVISIVFIGYAVWYILDLIFVPLGISLDNRRKLAIAKNKRRQKND